MKDLKMPPIEVKHPEKRHVRIFVPGGWTAKVAEITADTATMNAYTRYFFGDADAARDVHQRVYERGYVNGLRLAIARRAQEYAAANPDLVEEMPTQRESAPFYVTLRGFDCSVLQSTYVPFDQPGRAGNDLMKDTLTELATRARGK